MVTVDREELALFDAMDERHPMFRYVPNPVMQVHREALFRQLAIELLRFDPEVVRDQPIIGFCRSVYDLARASDSCVSYWLIGAIVTQRVRQVDALKKRLDSNEEVVQPIHKEWARRNINVITDLCERFVQAITKETP